MKINAQVAKTELTSNKKIVIEKAVKTDKVNNTVNNKAASDTDLGSNLKMYVSTDTVAVNPNDTIGFINNRKHD